MRLLDEALFGGGRLLIQALSAIGDPVGRLETSTDLVAFSQRIRSTPVVKSRTGVLLSANLAICSEVLKSSEWRTVPETNRFMDKFLFGDVAASDSIDPILDSIISKDGDEHARLRRLIQPAFTHKVMKGWKELAERTSDQLLSHVASSTGPIEFVSQVANPLPITMICEILGVPADDRESFTSWGNTLARFGLDGPRSVSQRDELQAASQAITEYMSNLVIQRRKMPQDDLLSVLAIAEDEGSTLTNREIVATAAFVLVAGFETTVNLLSVGTATLIENKNQLTKVAANRDLVPNLVEESLRFVSPVQLTLRAASADTTLSDGTRVRKGQSMILMLVGANRDPEVFLDPDSLIVDRENARRNIAFGYGAHHCIGAALARLEAEVAWNRLLDRFPDVDMWEIVGEPTVRQGKTVRGFQTLVVKLGPAAPQGC